MAIFLPPSDRLIDDVTKVTNLCYYRPIDVHRRAGWGTEVLYGEIPVAYHQDGRRYEGRGNTYAQRIIDLVDWLNQH